MLARRTLVPSILLALALSRPAAAQDAGPPSPSATAEINALEQQLALATMALSGGGCVVACPALASMERAAERICALDPGPRCADARGKVRDAARRVREACPECRAGAFEAPPPVQAKAGEKPVVPAPPPSIQAAPADVSFHSAPRGGGCAGCVVGGEEPASSRAALLAAAALAALRLRRRRR